MISQVIKNIVLSTDTREDFENSNGRSMTKRGMELAAAVVTFVIVLLILSVVGKYLWNEVIAGSGSSKGLVTIAREATSIWQILGLYIFTALIFGN